MIVRQFLQWVRSAPAGERAEATSALARAYLHSDLSPDDRAGHPLGAGAVYRKLTGRYEVARALAFSPSQPDAPALPAPVAIPSVPAPHAPVPDTAGVTQAYADAQSPLALPPPSNLPSQQAKPLFQALFTDVPRHGVSPAVTKLWTPSQAAAQPAAQPSGLYNLFKDPQPATRRPRDGKV
ncbi:MAG TPA: hypothetical protein VE224_12010 [Pseudolabrys sp.]|nr:hypothetical protein [Pseudolabrys sp.]